jgi:hypothetical protein
MRGHLRNVALEGVRDVAKFTERDVPILVRVRHLQQSVHNLLRHRLAAQLFGRQLTIRIGVEFL